MNYENDLQIDGQLLRYARERHGISQRKLAEALKVTQKVLSYWEKGESRVRPKYYGQLEELLGIRIADICSSELRDDIVDEIVERGVNEAMAKSMYDVAIGPMIQERLNEIREKAAAANADPILQQLIDAWPKLTDSAKLKMVSIIAEIANR